jgi:hypothetical protein
MATTPPPAPTQGPATHEGVSRTPSLSLLCLDKIRLPRPNLCGSDHENNTVDFRVVGDAEGIHLARSEPLVSDAVMKRAGKRVLVQSAEELIEIYLDYGCVVVDVPPRPRKR